MNDDILFAYLAGAMDSDGYFTIRRSTYHQRVRHDAYNPTYSEKVGLKQVTPDIPQLLKDKFGGNFHNAKPQTENSKSLWVWATTDLNAYKVCAALLPYLRVKKQQALTLAELREAKDPKYRKLSYWYQIEHPSWQDEELITSSQAAVMLNYSHRDIVAQAIRNKTLLSLPYNHVGKERPKIPLGLVEELIPLYELSRGKGPVLPPQLIEWRQSLYEKVRELNKIGVNGTPVYHRTGVYKPID